MSKIQSLQARLQELTPDAPGVVGWGETWTASALDALEREHGCSLPAEYRWFLETIGDGGPAPGLGLKALREQSPEDLARSSRPFVLERGWVTPTICDELEAEGLLGRYKKYLFELPEGSEPDDGTLHIGYSDDHQALLLVTSGPFAGKLWFDNRGNDYEEMFPSKRSFLLTVADYLQREVKEIEDSIRFDALVKKGDLGALREAFGDDEFSDRIGEIIDDGEPIPANLARMIAEFCQDHYAQAEQALVLGGCWLELEDRCESDWLSYELGKFDPGLRAEATIQAHLAIARVAMGRPGPVHEYDSSRALLGYWHYSRDAIPRFISRWEYQEKVTAVLDRLRFDVALEFLFDFPDEAFLKHLAYANHLGERFLDARAQEHPLARSIGWDVQRMVRKLIELLDAKLGAPVENALDTWFWVAGCTLHDKFFKELLLKVGNRFTPRYTTSEDALRALAERSLAK